MKQFLIAVLAALAIFAGGTTWAAERAPLLMEGKKTLYQRVVTHPGASLRAGQGKDAAVVQKAVRPFSVFYVYTRDGDWLEVGASTSKADGWMKSEETTPWNQALTLLFTDRSQRRPVLFFKRAAANGCAEVENSGERNPFRREFSSPQTRRCGAPPPLFPKTFASGADGDWRDAGGFVSAEVPRSRLLSLNVVFLFQGVLFQAVHLEKGTPNAHRTGARGGSPPVRPAPCRRRPQQENL